MKFAVLTPPSAHHLANDTKQTEYCYNARISSGKSNGQEVPLQPSRAVALRLQPPKRLFGLQFLEAPTSVGNGQGTLRLTLSVGPKVDNECSKEGMGWTGKPAL